MGWMQYFKAVSPTGKTITPMIRQQNLFMCFMHMKACVLLGDIGHTSGDQTKLRVCDWVKTPVVDGVLEQVSDSQTFISNKPIVVLLVTERAGNAFLVFFLTQDKNYTTTKF